MVKRNILSISMTLVVLYLSLAPSASFDKVSFLESQYSDKIVHFLMYLTLMSVIIFENRKIIKDIKQIFYIALIPVSLGIMMEIFQGLFTSSRTPSMYDILFNITGVLFSVFIWLYLRSINSSIIR